MAIVFNKAKANYVVPEEPRGSRAGGKSRNVMNRVPSVGRLESKDGANLDYFDDGKGSVSSTSYGGYKTAISSRVEDMDRVEDAINPRSMTSQKANSATFRGMVHMGAVGLRSIKIADTDADEAKYVENSGANGVLYLDGSRGGEIGTFVRTERNFTISKIIVDQTGKFLSSIVILESGGGNWTLDCDTGASGNDEISMDDDDFLYTNLNSGQFTMLSGGRIFLTQSSFDWKVQSVSSYSSLDVQFHRSAITLTDRSGAPAALSNSTSLYSVSGELTAKDSGNNVTTLSPHNFSLCGNPSEDMAWSYYSERGDKKINVDMLKLARLVEGISGEKLVYTEKDSK